MPRTLTALLLSLVAAHGFAQQRAAGAPPTLRTETKLVIVDITVTDQGHHPIHGLKAADFAVLENNISQPVKNFEEHLAPTSEQLAKVSAMPTLPPNVFTNFTPAPAVVARGPVNVLLIDRLNTPLMAQARLRNEVLNYLKKAKPGQRIAIFVLTSQLSLVQGFTSDPGKLSAVIQKSSGRSSPLIDGDASPDIAGLADSPDTSLIPGEALKFDTEVIPAYMQMDRSKRTLEAMNDLARYLVGIPGRKNVIWFSGSFPLQLLPGQDGDGRVVADVQAEFHETLSLLSRAQVAIYPVEATGVTTSNCFSLAKSGPACGPDERRNESDSTWEIEHTMNALAHETGGRAFMFNDLSREIGEAIDDGSSYYTLAYTPTDSNWDGTFRKVELRLRQQGYVLSYRRGYYADDLLHPPSAMEKWARGREVSETLGPPPDFSPMHLAMMHGGPEPTEIVFTAKVQRANAALEDAPASGNLFGDHLPPEETKGPFRRYSIDYAAYLRAGDFRDESGGMHHGRLQFVVFAYDRDGRIVSLIDRYVTLDLNAAQYAQTLKDGILFHEDLSVPEKGQYSFRIAIHDTQGGRIGAVEVPLAAVRDVEHRDLSQSPSPTRKLPNTGGGNAGSPTP